MKRCNRLRRRGVVALFVALAAVLPLVFFGSGAASAADESLEKNPQLFTVTQVLVNSSGGITVTGKIDCTQAVEEWGQDGYMAAVNVDWTARQPIGRKGVVTAHYVSSIMEPCFDPEVVGPYTWATHPPITSTDIWWVYPDTGGKFVGGKIHIEAQATGGSFSPEEGADQYLLTGVTQWDGQATNDQAGKGGRGHKK